jgi:exonuclease III
MKLLTFNCRGLASPQKKSALKQSVTLHQPDVVLFQETLIDEVMATKILTSLLSGWFFLGLDARGRSSGLVIGWRSRSIKLLNSWAFDSCLGGDFLVEGIGKEIRIINVYGPHTDQNSFWETLLGKYLLKNDFIILGGDLNFSLGEAESWGPSSHPDNQAAFFSHLLSSNGLIDIAPLKLLPTWRNMRVGEACIAKRLDRFLISESLAMLPFQFFNGLEVEANQTIPQYGLKLKVVLKILPHHLNSTLPG